jgi:AraC-like DNA-binding protein
MTQASSAQFSLGRAFRIVLVDLGISPANVLARAGLPADLFAREVINLTAAEYFALWRGFEEEASHPTPILHLVSTLKAEVFDAPLFAALCSPNLNVAALRVQAFKRLIGPLTLDVEVTAAHTRVAFEVNDYAGPMPASFMVFECLFFVQIARMATRTHVVPLRIELAELPSHLDAHIAFAGVTLTHGSRNEVLFRAADAARPFVTADARMWEFFEPELRKRLAQVEMHATVGERVQAALLDLLPSGRASMDHVAKSLAVSARTLQRRLQAEGASFQALLAQSRQRLAHHYLRSSELTSPEIALLLGFEDSNSFYRAFREWTGTTPEQARLAFRTAS